MIYQRRNIRGLVFISTLSLSLTFCSGSETSEENLENTNEENAAVAENNNEEENTNNTNNASVATDETSNDGAAINNTTEDSLVSNIDTGSQGMLGNSMTSGSEPLPENNPTLTNSSLNPEPAANSSSSPTLVNDSASTNLEATPPAPDAGAGNIGAPATDMIPQSRTGFYVKYVTQSITVHKTPGGNVVDQMEQGDHPLVMDENDWAKTSEGYYISQSGLSSKAVGRKRHGGKWK